MVYDFGSQVMVVLFTDVVITGFVPNNTSNGSLSNPSIRAVDVLFAGFNITTILS